MRIVRRIRLGAGAALALAATAAAAGLLTARPGDAELYPPRPGEPAVVVYVLARGLDAALVAPAPLLGDQEGPWTRLAFDRSGRPRLTAMRHPVGPGSDRAVSMTLSQRGLERLRASLASPAGTGLRLAGRPLTVNTPSQRLAGALHAAGVPAAPLLDLAGPGLLLDLAWFGGATPIEPARLHPEPAGRGLEEP